jgi:GDP-L-fucose synthase
MNLPDERQKPLPGSNQSVSGRFEPPPVKIGVSEDVTIAGLAVLVFNVVGYEGGIVYDTSQPDATPQKLMDAGLLCSAAWQANIPLEPGLGAAYAEVSAAAGSQRSNSVS